MVEPSFPQNKTFDIIIYTKIFGGELGINKYMSKDIPDTLRDIIAIFTKG